MNFLQKIKEQAKTKKVTIVLPEGNDERTLKAAQEIIAEGICNIILVGKESDAEGYKLPGVQFIDPATYDMTSLVEGLVEIRKSKGLTPEQAKELLETNPLYLGCMLVKKGIAQGMVAGAINSTGDVMRAGLQVLKTAPGTKLVSTFFVMIVPGYEQGFVFSDCALVQSPSAEELASIAGSSAKSYRSLLGDEPIVAMLSHSTRGSAAHPDVDKVREATRIAKEQYPDIKIDGELQLDAAIVPSVGASKAKGSDVAGKANVLVFPDIDAGNIGYKLTQRFAKAEAYGPIAQGLGAPLNDLSRGCSAEDIIGVVAITAVQAGQQV
ncbi:MAG: phosphate acetyltransferase [Defluviitaleaceae bacterium]|nr:phosphate acetyltransferase [Defluviitaleaceae bacterium]